MGVGTSNPITDKSLYEVEYLDGTVETLASNVISENLLSQVDQEGHRQLLIDEIICHRKNPEAVKKKDSFYSTRNVNLHLKETTKEWGLCVQWKGGSSNWVSLKDLNNSYPVETDDYAVANWIDQETAFAWWIPCVLNNIKAILQNFKSKYIGSALTSTGSIYLKRFKRY